MIDLVLEGAGSFDSELNRRVMNESTNAELTLSLKVYLHPRDPGPVQDWDHTNFTAVAWGKKEFAAWKKHFKSQAQTFWNGKFWLKAPKEAADFKYANARSKATYLCNVWCRFELVLSDSAAGAHKTIDVVHLVPTAGYNSTTFRSDDSTYDNYDLGVTTYNVGGKAYKHRTIIHEMGHALGLPHIGVMTNNAQCAAANNIGADPCYGVNDTERSDVMGYGTGLSNYDARPWLKRLAEHLEVANTDTWTPVKYHARPVRV